MGKNSDPKISYILDSHEYNYWSRIENSLHISVFHDKDEDVREEARKWITDLSTKVSNVTGKPFYQSFMYKGISAWWFIEINLHEPAYMSLRRNKALARAAKEGPIKFIKFHPARVPNVLPEQKDIEQTRSMLKRYITYFFSLILNLFKFVGKPVISFRNLLIKALHKFKKIVIWPINHIKNSFLTYNAANKHKLFYKILSTLLKPFFYLGIFLYKGLKGISFKKIILSIYLLLKKLILWVVKRLFISSISYKQVLIIIEEENLKRSFDPLSQKHFTYIPYAEGIIENISQVLGDEVEVLSRNPLRKSHKDWPFLVKSLPPLQIEDLPTGFNEIIDELYSWSEELLINYLSAKQLKEIMQFRLAEFNLYLEILEKINPKLIFSYNWEGVFRPLITAARLQNRKIVGIQQALGPYGHGIDHHEIGYWTSNNDCREGFCIPDTYLIWSDFHKNQIRSYEYDECGLKTTGYTRLDRHYYLSSQKEKIRNDIAKTISLDPQKRYLLLTAQYSVLDTCLILKESYIKSFQTLLLLADEFDFNIIFKPWASDNISFLFELASQRPDRVYFATQDLLVHNADLLTVTEWCVGTFSSIMGEATLMKNQCFILNYSESRYYFGDKYIEIYRGMAVFIDSPDVLESIMRSYLIDKGKSNTDAPKQLRYIFGDCNGQGAKKCTEIILKHLKEDKNCQEAKDIVG